MTNVSDLSRDSFMLVGPLAKKGYDWWWHSFTARNKQTGEEKPFFVEFFVCNPALAQDKPVIVWNDPEARAKGVRPSYLMVKVGWWVGSEKGQMQRFFAWKDVKISKNGEPINIVADDCSLSETHVKGHVAYTQEESEAHPEYMSDFGDFKFDLKIQKDVTFNVGYGASKFFRDINSFEMFWHAEGMKSYFEGTIELNGVEYVVTPDTCYGYDDKNWGGDFTEPWVWLSSNNLVSKLTGKQLKNSVFEVGGGNPKVFGIPLGRKLLGTFWHEGEDFEFNFSKFWTGSRTKFDCRETEEKILWHVEQTTFKAKMLTDIQCFKRDMIFINYEAPNGTKRYTHLWNGGNGTGVVKLFRRKGFFKFELIDEVEAKNVGCEYGVYDD